MSELRKPARRRRWKRYLIGAAGMLLVLVLVYPVWLPWALKPLAARFGVHYERYERHGYGSFELAEVRWTSGSTTARAADVRIETPHRFLWRRLTGAAPTDPQVVVHDWQVEISPPESPSTAGNRSTCGLLDELQDAVPSLTPWLDWIVLSRGEIGVAGKDYPIDSVALQAGRLQVNALKAQATVDLTTLATASLRLTVSNQLGTAEIGLNGRDARWVFDGGVLWRSNRFQLNGWFDRTNWVPAVATLGSDSLQVSLALPALGTVVDLRGNAQAAWTNGLYRFNVDLSNQREAGRGRPPERIALRMKGRGGLETVRIDELDLESPLAKATLEQPLTLDYSGRVRQGSAALHMWADLGRIRGIPLTGLMSGEIALQPVRRSLFQGRFDLRGTGVEGFGVRTETLELVGRLDWPNLELGTITATFPFGGSLSARLTLDVSDRRLKDLQWQITGTAPGLLPGSLRMNSLRASGSASGVWPDLNHTGRVEVTGVEAGVFRAAVGDLQWSGRKLVLDRLTARLTNGSSSIEFTGQADLLSGTNGMGANVGCDALDLVTQDGVWRLKEPFRFNLLRQTHAVRLNLSPLDLAGPESRVTMEAAINWPSRGSGKLTLHRLRPSQWEAFLAPDVSQVTVPEAALSFSWDNSPILWDLDAEAQWRPETNQVWSATGHVRADGQSVQFDSVHVDLDDTPCAELTGNLPLRFEPETGWSVAKGGADGETRFDLHVLEKAPVWPLLEQKAGLRVESPSAVMRLHGTLPDLRGELVLNAARVQLVQSNSSPAFVWPPLEHLHADVTAGRTGVEVRQMTADLLGQGIEARAQWPVAASNWDEWLAAFRNPDWKRVTGALHMRHADLSALSAMAPGLIAPVGKADLDLALDPGWRVNGHLAVTNGATRFLDPVGAVRDIDGDLVLDGWNATINTFTGTLAGRPVSLSGETAWRPDGDRRLDLRLKGKNLSLLRDPDLFVRADLDLHLQKAFGDVARLSGDVALRRSLLLRDFNSLVGLDREQPGQRPPYFSIPQPPFGDWQLDVRVKGDRFLNVISPAFKGEVSAGLHLLGTLREPQAVGAVTVDEGKILFPFGMVELENGRVDLTREHPYRPELDLQAVGQNFGYSITVDITGPADEPNVTFQSVPPLSAQQILLMLTAGEVPRSNLAYSSADKAARVGLYVGREFVNRFIGNTSASERLMFRSGQNLTDEGRPTYLLEYRLTDRWAVFGEYDRFQDFNSGLKFKVLSK